MEEQQNIERVHPTYDTNVRYHTHYKNAKATVLNGQSRRNLVGLTTDLGEFSNERIGKLCALHLNSQFGFITTSYNALRELEKRWPEHERLDPTVKSIEDAKSKLDGYKNVPKFTTNGEQLIFPIILQTIPTSIQQSQTLPTGVRARYAANLVHIPDHILATYPDLRLTVWYYHYFRNLIIFESRDGAEKFVDFHLKRRRRLSRRSNLSAREREEYHMSGNLLDYPLRCVDDLAYVRYGTKGIRLGVRNQEPRFRFGSPDIKTTTAYKQDQAKLKTLQNDIVSEEEDMDALSIDNLEEEKKGLLADLKEYENDIKGLKEKIEEYGRSENALKQQLVNLSNKPNKRKAGDHGAGGSDTRPSKKRLQ